MRGNRKEAFQISLLPKHYKSVLPQPCQFALSPFNLLCKWCVRVWPARWALYSQMKRIRSVPGNRVLPVRSSAIIHPTDQISTERHRSRTQTLRFTCLNNSSVMMYRCRKSPGEIKEATCHVVMHPVQHDLWGTVPAGGHIAGHLIISVPRQTKVQNLGAIEVQKAELFAKYSHLWINQCFKWVHCSSLTFSSQSSFTARLLGFKSWWNEIHKYELV